MLRFSTMGDKLISVQHCWNLATSWTVMGSNPGGGEIFHTHPDRSWGPVSLLHNGYRVSFPGVKRPGRGDEHPTPSSAEVKERVELYLYSPFWPSRPVVGWTLVLEPNRREAQHSKNNLFQWHFTRNLTCVGLGSNSVFRGTRPATNRLSHSTVHLKMNTDILQYW